MTLSPKTLWPLWILTTAVYLILLTVTVPTLQHTAGMAIPDTLPSGYTPTYLQTLFTALGETGRAYYRFPQLALDTLYPALFGLTYALILHTFLRKCRWRRGNILILLPIFAAAGDYLENLMLFIMLNQYPDISATLARISSLASIGKSIGVILTLLATALLGVLVLRQRLKRNDA